MPRRSRRLSARGGRARGGGWGPGGPASERPPPGPRRDAAQLETLEREAGLLLGVVDRADLALLDRPDLPAEPRRGGQAPAQLRQRRAGPGGDHPAAVAELRERADQEPPLGALDDRHVRRILAARDPRPAPPDEGGTVEGAGRHLGLDPVLAAAIRHGLALPHDPGEHAAVGERQAHDVLRPEEAEAVHEDERHEADDQEEAQGECAAGQPDERLAAPPEVPHRYRYFLRSRIRTSSAAVLTTNVRQKRRRAARNRTRNSVPPSGASGSSTAMLAESARKPSKMDQSITGVLPVAMSTIIVSPTARPKPIMTPEKMPGLAVP